MSDPDRSRLPIRRSAFSGVVNRTLDGSQPDWNLIGHPTPPDGAPRDGQMWRAITDLLEDPHVTPKVRAALLDVAAGLQGARLEVGGVDPVGREADVVIFGNWGGELIERLYVDPASHDLLAITWTSEIADRPFQYYVVERAGVAASRSSEPTVAESIPALGSPSPTFQPGPEH